MFLDEESGDAVFVGFGTCGFQEVVEFGGGEQTVDVLGGVPGGAWVGFDAFLCGVADPYFVARWVVGCGVCGGAWSGERSWIGAVEWSYGGSFFG